MFKRVIMLSAVLAVASAAPSAARPGDGGPGQSAHQWPLKDRACVAECRTETTACLRAARAATAACFEGCADLVEAARIACEADPDGQACEQARLAARACLAPCNELLRPAVRACIAAGHKCVRECPFVGEPPCLTECRVDHVACQSEASKALRDCRQGCRDKVEAARLACAEEPDSEACAAAKRAVHQCLRPCREGYKEDLDACRVALRACVVACGEEEDGAD